MHPVLLLHPLAYFLLAHILIKLRFLNMIVVENKFKGVDVKMYRHQEQTLSLNLL